MSIQAPASARPAVATGVVCRVEGGLLPMVRLRAPVLRVGHQLHRSPGHRHSEADAAAAVRMERARLRRHRVFVSARLRDRLPVCRPADGPSRHAGRFCNRDRRLEHRGDGARRVMYFGGATAAILGDVRPHLQRLGCRLHGRALRAGTRRSRQLSRRHQDGRRMVPAQGARVRDRHLQRGHEHRRAADAADRSGHHARVGMGVGVHRDWRARVHLAGAAGGCCIARRKSTRASPRPSLRTSAAIRRSRRQRCRGERFFRIGRRGPSQSRSS